ncbi:MAG TPA: hypothetical protein VMT89_01975 [Candidatus Acidoferrales bacterium]|nr:hypothetical protein [Candidatus Acidoferrales bacterium]
MPDYDAIADWLRQVRKVFLGPDSGMENFNLAADGLNRLACAQRLVDDQANDEGLWFEHVYITEDTLQRALRNLHSAIED